MRLSAVLKTLCARVAFVARCETETAALAGDPPEMMPFPIPASLEGSSHAVMLDKIWADVLMSSSRSCKGSPCTASDLKNFLLSCEPLDLGLRRQCMSQANSSWGADGAPVQGSAPGSEGSGRVVEQADTPVQLEDFVKWNGLLLVNGSEWQTSRICMHPMACSHENLVRPGETILVRLRVRGEGPPRWPECYRPVLPGTHVI